jgi:hypothetical protein
LTPEMLLPSHNLRLPLSQQADCEKKIESMANGVIEPGQSPWASPIVLVRKKDGFLRFCVDYRHLNSVTKFDAYLLSRIEETLEALGGAKWFINLGVLASVPDAGSQAEKCLLRTQRFLSVESHAFWLV